MKCVVSRIDLPCCSKAFRRSHIRCRACGSRPVVGSSSSSRSGSLISARASDRRRFMPPDNSPGLAAALDCSAANSSSRGTRSAMRRARQAEVAAEDAQVLGTGEVGVEAVELRDDADALLGFAHRCRESAGRRCSMRAGVGRHQAEAHAQRGGLAGAVGADHAQALAGRDRERQVVDDALAVVVLDEAVDAKQWLAAWCATVCQPQTNKASMQLALFMAVRAALTRRRSWRRRPSARAGRPVRRRPSARCRRHGSPSSGCACSRPGGPCSAGRAR